MMQPQKGVCAEPSLHAQYLLFNVVDEDPQVLREKLSRILDIFDDYENDYFEAMVTGLIAIGAGFWDELYPESRPAQLTAFPKMECEDRSAPDTGGDIFIQIRADRLDVCHAIANEIMDLLHLHVELQEQVQGFRYLDGRDLNGFVYGAENPRGMLRRQVAVVSGEIEPGFEGGSYMHIQRYRYDLRRWKSLSNRQQEQVIGKTRQHNTDSDEQSASSHCVRARAMLPAAVPGNETPTLVKQGMPYGNVILQGLFFVSCAASGKAFENMLHNQVTGNEDGDYDRWLDFASAETGGAFFAPAIGFIRQHAC